MSPFPQEVCLAIQIVDFGFFTAKMNLKQLCSRKIKKGFSQGDGKFCSRIYHPKTLVLTEMLLLSTEVLMQTLPVIPPVYLYLISEKSIFSLFKIDLYCGRSRTLRIEGRGIPRAIPI